MSPHQLLLRYSVCNQATELIIVTVALPASSVASVHHNVRIRQHASRGRWWVGQSRLWVGRATCSKDDRQETSPQDLLSAVLTWRWRALFPRVLAECNYTAKDRSGSGPVLCHHGLGHTNRFRAAASSSSGKKHPGILYRLLINSCMTVYKEIFTNSLKQTKLWSAAYHLRLTPTSRAMSFSITALREDTSRYIMNIYT